MSEDVKIWTLAVLGMATSLAMTYGLALAGEPRAHWLLCTVMGLCS